MHALGLEFGSAARLSKRPGSVWNCLWGHALKRSPGIIRKSRVSYPVPGFLSSATWPLLPKKHYNGLKKPILSLRCAVIASPPRCGSPNYIVNNDTLCDSIGHYSKNRRESHCCNVLKMLKNFSEIASYPRKTQSPEFNHVV